MEATPENLQFDNLVMKATYQKGLKLLFFSFFILHASFFILRAQSISSPQIRCVEVDSVGDVTLAWLNTSSIPANFISYNIYDSTSGSIYYDSAAVVLGNSFQTTTTIFQTTANLNRYYFIIYDSTKRGNSVPLDTVSSILLKLNTVPGVAELSWNPIHNPPLSSASPWYKVYREYPQYVWKLIDSTENLFYNDTVQFCDSVNLNYRVENADSSECNSISNIVGNKFSDIVGPPVVTLDTVSVNPSGSVDISWQQSRDTNVIGYIIYIVIGSQYIPLATVYGLNTTFFQYTGLSPDSNSLTFVVAAFDRCNNLGNYSYSEQNTIHLKDEPDSCKETNTLEWTKYNGLIGGVKGYEVFVSTNSSPFSLLGKTSPYVRTFIDSNLSIPETRCYLVRVVDSLRSDTTASSNIVCYRVTISNRQQAFYLNNATVINHSTQNMVQCYIIDTLPGISYYQLQRANTLAGPYVPIDTISAPKKDTVQFLTFIDYNVSPGTQSYCYKVIAENACYRNIDTSNIGQTIYLSGMGEPTEENILSWNSYENWTNNVNCYLVYRSLDGITYTMLDDIPATGVAEYTLEDNVYEVTVGFGIFYYYVQAIENTSTYPFIDTSTSNIALCYQNPKVFIPDAFSPGGTRNNIFIPVGVFINVQGYQFTVFNRWGEIVFQTTNPLEGWNGKFQEQLAQEGVYAYLLTYTSSKGEYFQQKGTVTLLR